MTRFAMLVQNGIPDDDHYHYYPDDEDAKADAEEEAKLRQTLTFSDHVARMFTPLKAQARPTLRAHARLRGGRLRAPLCQAARHENSLTPCRSS
jgi:hypothetical protein